MSYKSEQYFGMYQILCEIVRIYVSAVPGGGHLRFISVATFDLTPHRNKNKHNWVVLHAFEMLNLGKCVVISEDVTNST